MQKHWLFIGGLTGAAVFFLLFHACQRENVVSNEQPIVLPKEASAVVRITPTAVTTVARKKDESVVSTIVPTYSRPTTVTVKPDGSVSVKVKTYGWSNDFGLSIDHKSIGVAHEFAYWRSLSIMGSMHPINHRTGELQLDLGMGIGYRFQHSKFNNLSIATYITLDKKVVTRLFFRFGN